VPESDKPQQHTLRPADSTVTPLTPEERKYWGRIAGRTTQILKQKIREGKLKRSSGKRRGHVNKVAIVMVLLAIVFSVTIAVAQYRGQFQAQTQIVSPIMIPQTSFTIPNIILNKTASLIIDNAFYVNTSGNTITYTFLVYGSTTVNGTETQDMTKLFYNFQIIFSDYSRNVTLTNLLLPNQPVSFTYQNNSNQAFRIIIVYSSKPIQMSTTDTSTPLTINFTYGYSGQ